MSIQFKDKMGPGSFYDTVTKYQDESFNEPVGAAGTDKNMLGIPERAGSGFSRALVESMTLDFENGRLQIVETKDPARAARYAGTVANMLYHYSKQFGCAERLHIYPVGPQSNPRDKVL